MKQGQKGFSVVETLVIIIVIAAIGSVGWLVWHRHSSKSPSSNTQSSTAKNANCSPSSSGASQSPSNPSSSSPYWDTTYTTASSSPTQFSAGTVIAEHTSVPDAIQLTKSVDCYQKNDLLVYFVDFSHVSGPGTESLSVVRSSDSGKTWGQKVTITIKNKVNKGAAVDPSIVQLSDGRLRLYFFGSEITSGDPAAQNAPHRVYSAISTDGINFTTEDGFRLEDSNLTDPEVVLWQDQWYMYYSVGSSSQLAVSKDGLNFTKQTLPDNGIGGVPGALVLSNGIRLYGCKNGISTGLATDGVHFTKDGSNIVAGATCDPSVIKLADGQFLMTYKIHKGGSGTSEGQVSPPSGSQPQPSGATPSVGH